MLELHAPTICAVAPFTVPEKWIKKTLVVMPPEDERMVFLGEHFDPEHGYSFEQHFHIVTPCFCWQGWNDGKGHGKVRHEGKGCFVHRLSYEWANDLVLREEDVIDHLCRNRACWNPTHLDCVTMAVNTARGLGRFNQFKPREAYAG